MPIEFKGRRIETDQPDCPLDADRDPEPAARPAACAGMTLSRTSGHDV